MYSIQNGIDSDENRTRALKGLFATQTPSSGGVGVQFAVEESSRRPATGARNLNCILTVVRSPFFFFSCTGGTAFFSSLRVLDEV